MGLFKKVRDILFDEEEYTEQIKLTPEMRNEETPLKEETAVVDKKETREEPVMVNTQPTVSPAATAPKKEVSERELFKSDSSFPFFDFDEEEFDQQKPARAPEKPMPEKRSNNVFDYERKKKIEKRTDFGRYEKTEITETIERKKFKPSPIISPVYGIMDQNFDKSDIIKKRDPDKVDIQSVRDKAFGEKKERSKIELSPKTTFYEETETVTISEPEEKEKKVKTIDELLEDTSDLVVDIDRDLESEIELPSTIETKYQEPEIEVEKTHEIKVPEVEDTLENDLFDLIDSMYDSKEDGE